MNKSLQLLLVSTLLVGVLCLTGCGGNGLADYNQRVTSMAGSGAGKIAYHSNSNFHSTDITLSGGSVTQLESGERVIEFTDISYLHSNPLFKSGITAEDYVRVVPPADPAKAVNMTETD